MSFPFFFSDYDLQFIFDFIKTPLLRCKCFGGLWRFLDRNYRVNRGVLVYLLHTTTFIYNLCSLSSQVKRNKIWPGASGGIMVPKLPRSHTSRRLSAGHWSNHPWNLLDCSWSSGDSNQSCIRSRNIPPIWKSHDIFWEITKHTVLVVDEVREVGRYCSSLLSCPINLNN